MSGGTGPADPSEQRYRCGLTGSAWGAPWVANLQPWSSLKLLCPQEVTSAPRAISWTLVRGGPAPAFSYTAPLEFVNWAGQLGLAMQGPEMHLCPPISVSLAP